MRYFKIYTFALAACLALAACDDNDINITPQLLTQSPHLSQSLNM